MLSLIGTAKENFLICMARLPPTSNRWQWARVTLLRKDHSRTGLFVSEAISVAAHVVTVFLLSALNSARLDIRLGEVLDRIAYLLGAVMKVELRVVETPTSSMRTKRSTN